MKGFLLAAALGVACVSASASAAVVTFSDLSLGDWTPVPSSYQPVSGVTIAWTGFTKYGSATWSNGLDHTQSVDAGAPSTNIGTAYGGDAQPSHNASMTFSEPVTVPSVWVSNIDHWEQNVTLNGYTHATDVTAAITVTVPWSSIPSHGTNTVSGAWYNVTGLAGVPIERLELVGNKNQGPWQVGGAVMDDLTVLPVPEPASLGALALAGLLVGRRRRA